jgi:hypothetical protein
MISQVLRLLLKGLEHLLALKQDLSLVKLIEMMIFKGPMQDHLKNVQKQKEILIR